MKGLNWDRFVNRAAIAICRDCEFGFARPWRDGPTCQQAWLRFHASRGLILTCTGTHVTRGAACLEEQLMTAHDAHRSLSVDRA